MMYLYKVLFFSILVGCTTLRPISTRIQKNRKPKKVRVTKKSVTKTPKCTSSNWPIGKIQNRTDRFNVFWNLDLPAVGLISSYFGVRKGKCHYGIDIHTVLGSKVKAIYGGIVKYNGRLGSYGNTVVLDHLNGYYSLYAHNKKNLVKRGALVRKGQTIAVVGRTGRATGPHVHLEIKKGNKSLDPLLFFQRSYFSFQKLGNKKAKRRL